MIAEVGSCDPLRGLQKQSVSNDVSKAIKLVNTMANLSGQIVLRLGENWTSERTGE